MKNPVISPLSDTWVVLRGLLRFRIEELRDQLEQAGDPSHTRGEIAALRWLISSVEVEPRSTDDESVDYFPSRPSDPS